MELRNDSNAPILLSAGQIGEFLGIHVKTVRRYIKEGRLKAFRIGRSYRVHAADLAALTGQPLVPGNPTAPRQHHIEASTIVQIDAIDAEEATRLVNRVGGAIKGRDRHTDTPLRVDTVHDEARSRLKIIITGSIATTTALLQLIST